MIEVFYILLLIVFGALSVAAVTHYLIHLSGLREEIQQCRERLTHQQGRIAMVRQQLGDLQVDLDLLALEQESLEAQKTCMRNLESMSYAGAPAREGR